ncbi:MAG: hypothetical protein ACEPOV_00510 [Hyphomicrobiales bacterium]
MGKIRVKLLTFKGAGESVLNMGKEKVYKIFGKSYVKFVDEHPEVLYFVTGGSEEEALRVVERRGRRFYLLLADSEHNAYASATEVKAWLNQNIVRARLLQIGVDGSDSLIKSYFNVRKAFWKLQNTKIGLFGKPSDWLVASTIPFGRLKDWLGITLQQIDWSDFNPEDYPQDEKFLSKFQPKCSGDLGTTSAVSQFMMDQIKLHKLDAITVECFPMVQEKGITACLPLSLLNDNGVPAGCEGDITAITGMMIGQALTGSIPWMANTVEIDKKRSLFAHCTIGTNMLNDYNITTHFETGKGTAIQGDFKHREVTIFRVNRNLERGFVTNAMITHTPKLDTACRTQVKVQMPEKAVETLRDQPLGNHHLFLPGDHVEEIKMAFELLGMEIV